MTEVVVFFLDMIAVTSFSVSTQYICKTRFLLKEVNFENPVDGPQNPLNIFIVGTCDIILGGFGLHRDEFLAKQGGL